MKYYRIRDWAVHFENNRTRELKRMDWVPVPNKHDGDGFTELLSHPSGLAHYGAWHLILQVASKCDPRGTLLRDGAAGGKRPHTPESLSRITRGDEKTFKEAIERLISIGWIEVCENTAPSCDNPAPQCVEVTMEWKGMEGNGSTPLPPKRGCEIEIYEAYPRHIGRPVALKAIKKALSKLPSEDLLIKTKAYALACQGSDPQYIPHPSTWFNQERFNDDPSTWKNNGSAAKPKPSYKTVVDQAKIAVENVNLSPE